MGNIECDKVVIATGSNAGTNYKENFGLDYLKKLGHSIIEPVPALVKLISDTKYLKKWDGIRSDVKLSLYENDTLIGKNLNSGIYVPRVLLNDYKTATNWVALSNYIYAIEDYPDITGG